MMKTSPLYFVSFLLCFMFSLSFAETLTKHYPQYDLVLNFSDGKAAAMKNEHWGYINSTGEAIIPLIYDAVDDKFNDGLVAAKKNGLWGYINESGQPIIPFEYENLADFKEGASAAQKNGKWGFIDKKGNTIIPFLFDSHGFFEHGVCIISRNGKYRVITRQNQILFPFQYDKIYDFINGAAIAEINSQEELLSIDGHIIIPAQLDYTYIGNFYDDLILVLKNLKFGYLNRQGQIAIPFKYDQAMSFKNGIAKVEVNSKSLCINTHGETVTCPSN